jgi:hypothetical protein
MLPYPAWINGLNEDQRESAKTRFLIRVYALYASEEGTVSEFARVLGLGMNQIKTQTQPAYWSPLPVETAIKIEFALGREVAPREALRPDVFLIPEAVSK